MYITGCLTCQKTKYPNKPPLGLLTPLHVPASPWNTISMDFLYVQPVFLDASKVFPNISYANKQDTIVEFSKILVIVCNHSKYKFLIPVSSDITAQQVVDIMNILIFPTIGYPFSITLDRDPLFTSHVFKDWASEKGTKLDFSTGYHHQTSGQVEVVNRELMQVMKLLREEGKNWLAQIPEIQFKLNSRYDESR